MHRTKFLNMESCNFVDYPKGGQTTFAKQIMNAYRQEVALVGITTDDNIPVGKWTKININGIEFDYFAVARVLPTFTKPLIPKRLQMYFAFKKYKKEIFSLGVHNVFVQSPEILFAIEDLPWKSICHNMPGIENPIGNTRYAGAKYLANLFDFFYLKSLKHVDKILASADHRTIQNFLATRGKEFKAEDIIHFPTRVETDLFYPIDRYQAREKLGINEGEGPLFVVTGRLAKIKGWKLLIDSFIILGQTHLEAKLYFIGDGEDRSQIETYIDSHGLMNNVVLIGAVKREEVVLWINAADVILVGSFMEGWSLSMMESAACAKPIVTTDVSGALDVIEEGVNGYICKERDSQLFSAYMENALALNRDNMTSYSLAIIDKYAVSHLKEELDQLWER